MQTGGRLAKNAVANLARGGTAGVVSLILPALLLRHMSEINYSVWILVLQIGAYSAYLELGLQTAVGRYIAIANENGDGHQRDSIFSTALAALSVAATIAIGALIAVALNAGALFPRVPATLLPGMRWALLIAGSSIALGLPASAWSGVFIGLQRNEFIAMVTGGSRLISAAGLIVAAIHGSSLVMMAVVLATINLASYVLLYMLLARLSCVKVSLRLVERAAARELVSYCSGLTVWSFGMILVSGLDLLLVGRFQLTALVPYALATTLVNLVAGTQSAIFTAAMPHAAVLHARKDSAALGRLVISSTRLATILLVLTGTPLLIYSSSIMRIWVGEQLAVQGHLLMAVLVIASMVRFTAMPYSIVLVAAAQQRFVTLSPLLEGFSNLFASILLGINFGAMGVAGGTLIGAIIGILGHLFYNMRRTRSAILFPVRDFILSALCGPLVVTSPMIVLTIRAYQTAFTGALLFGSVYGTTVLFSVVFILHAERSQLRLQYNGPIWLSAWFRRLQDP